MSKNSSAASVIGGADGPTSVFLLKRNQKLTLRQKFERWKNSIKKAYIERTLKPGSHTLDEVMEYIVNKHGFTKLDNTSGEMAEEYNHMRASCIIQDAPELLGEYAEMPRLKGESPEDIQLYMQQTEARTQKALEIPTTVYDIDFHKFQKNFADINDNIHIIIEKNHSYIGGGAAGNKKVIKQFRRIYKDIYRYYGVTQEDIDSKSQRYKDVVRGLMH